MSGANNDDDDGLHLATPWQDRSGEQGLNIRFLSQQVLRLNGEDNSTLYLFNSTLCFTMLKNSSDIILMI